MRVVFSTCPTDKADYISDELLNSQLVACINIIPLVKSKYWWEGKIQTDDESLLIIKTSDELMDKLIVKIKEIHNYQVPEIISFEIKEGNKDYLDWMKEVLKIS
jgi:periplasmic divalent cation tolerance protein